MAFATTIYNTFFKRNSIFVATIFGGAFAFGGFFDVAVSKWWDQHNQGKLWKDIKGKYVQAGDDDEDDE